MYQEDECVELKKSTSELKEAIVSIVAILNKHKRGNLYFGIRDNGDVIGQQISSQTIRNVSKMISENIEPRIYPNVLKVELQNKECILVEFEGEDIPYFAYGRAYMRVGDEDRQLTQKEIKKIILKINENGKIKNAGYVLFGKYPQIQLRTAIFATEEKTTFLDMQDFRGNIFNLIDAGEQYIAKNIRWSVNFNTGTFSREEIPEIPIRAMREILCNSFCH